MLMFLALQNEIGEAQDPLIFGNADILFVFFISLGGGGEGWVNIPY